MKKKVNWTAITVTALVIVGLVLGIKTIRGIIEYHEEKIEQHEELVSLVKEETPKIKRYVQTEDDKKVMHTITIEYEKTDFDPTGAVTIYGYVNNDRKLSFEVVADFGDEKGKTTLSMGAFYSSKKLNKLEA